jgi:TatD DNase family protein
MPLNIIDIGINLLHSSFDKDRESVVMNARNTGVTKMILTGTSEKNSIDCKAYAEKHPGILYSTAGVHPHDAGRYSRSTGAVLEKLASEKIVVAVGECGLDFNRDFSPRDVQEKVFESQIELAGKTGKPLFLHERDAHSRFVEILSANRNAFDMAVVHCFTGTTGEAKKYLDMGFFIGITGWICDERRGRHLLEVIRHIPLDRLMIETDAPYLLPRTIPGFKNLHRNEPAYLTEVLATISKAVGKSREEVASVTYDTTVNFFRLEG